MICFWFVISLLCYGEFFSSYLHFLNKVFLNTIHLDFVVFKIKDSEKSQVSWYGDLM